MSSSAPARTVIIDDGERDSELLKEIQSLRAEIDGIVRELASSGVYVRYLPVKTRGRIVIRKVDDVSWFEAHGKYVKLHTQESCDVIRQPLHSLESRLNPVNFIRVSRWAIINVEYVNYLEPWSNGEYAITMRTGHRVVSTESYRRGLQQLLRAG
jgi:two-component system LytT family response regulator